MSADYHAPGKESFELTVTNLYYVGFLSLFQKQIKLTYRVILYTVTATYMSQTSTNSSTATAK